MLVDDGSSDTTSIELKQFADYANVEVISKRNEGFVTSLQETIKNDQKANPTEFIAIHGAGDVSRPERLLRQVEFLDREEDLVLVASRHAIRDGATFMKFGETALSGYIGIEEARGGLGWTHGSVMYRTSAFFHAGGYDRRMKYCQDRELYLRILRLGKGYVLEDVLYDKLVFRDGATFAPRKVFEQHRFASVVITFATDDAKRDRAIAELHAEASNGKVIPDVSKGALKKYRRRVTGLFLRGQYELVTEWNIALNFVPLPKRRFIALLASVSRRLRNRERIAILVRQITATLLNSKIAWRK